MMCNDVLGNIIRSFKSLCTKQIHEQHNVFFRRQANYYDHIIEDKSAFMAIKRYIKNNPKKWDNDKNNCGLFA